MTIHDSNVPFEPDRPDLKQDQPLEGVEEDMLASGVDPADLGLDDDAAIDGTTTHPEAMP